MAKLEDFKKIIEIHEVKNYILVTDTGTIVMHRSPSPETLAGLVVSCGKSCKGPEKWCSGFLMVARQNQENLFVFPVGRYYLGVMKQATASNTSLVKKVLLFLRSLPGKEMPSKTA